MDTILHNAKCWFTTDGRLEVYNHTLANTLNKYFRKYDDGAYRFKAGEEAVFLVPQIEINTVLQRFLTRKHAQKSGSLGYQLPPTPIADNQSKKIQ